MNNTLLKLLVFTFWLHSVISLDTLDLVYPSTCQSRDTEYFDAVGVQCKYCGSEASLQIRGSSNISCRCVSDAKASFGTLGLECSQCPGLAVQSSFIASDCVFCSDNTGNCGSFCACPANSISAERDISGMRFSCKNGINSGKLTKKCITCQDGTKPSLDQTKCIPCFINVGLQTSTCECPGVQAGSYCFPKDVGNKFAGSVSSIVMKSVRSSYFENFLKASFFLCASYHNATACQALANMCVMTLYKDFQSPSIGSACGLYKRSMSASHLVSEKVPKLELEYKDKDETITTNYTLDSNSNTDFMQFYISEFTYDGIFIGLRPMPDGFLQLCSHRAEFIKSAFRFGMEYINRCSMSSRELWKKRSTFFDLFLMFNTSNSKKLIPIWSVIDHEDNKLDSEQKNWKYYHRFFLVDNINGKIHQGELPRAIRVADQIEIQVQLQDGTKYGNIYPPIVKVHYKVLQHDPDFIEDKLQTLSFKVTYNMDSKQILDVAYWVIGIGSVLLCLITIGRFCLVDSARDNDNTGNVNFGEYFGASVAVIGGYISVLILFVVYLFSIYRWLIFKNQSIAHVFPLTEGQERNLKNFIFAATVLKFVHIVYIIYKQCNIDIFFIDWEKPKREGQHVPPWRTFFVVNEWNELQTYRRVKTSLQLILVNVSLYYAGFGFWSSRDSVVHPLFSPAPTQQEGYVPQDSQLFRFAIIASCYFIIAFLQYVIVVFFYERFLNDAVTFFIDFCYWANISVFIRRHTLFGYYIHGNCDRYSSVEVDMKTLLHYFEQEKQHASPRKFFNATEGLSVFSARLPPKFNFEYNRVMQEAVSSTAFVPTEAYMKLNEFLRNFLGGNVTSAGNLSIVVQKRTFFEGLLDCEQPQNVLESDRAILYEDDEKAFMEVLLGGYEFSLVSFEILIFAATDFIAHNYAFAAFVTYLVMKGIAWVRGAYGKNNLEKKTYVSNTFLI